MGPDLRIDWDEVCVNPVDFEKLVKLLLVRLYPDGEVIDGRGGDGGREFQIRTAGSTVFYEAKSFTGRLGAANPARRPQVERSLRSAANNHPSTWHLVVPIDHNQQELAWFEKLRATRFPFIGQWHGQTWLEQELAKHPDLVRYATRNKLLELVGQYHLETAALAGGTRDLLDRHDALDQLGEEISPHWRPVVTHSPDGVRVVTLEAKHPDAAAQAPIDFHFTVEVPDQPGTAVLREQLQASRDYGTSVEIPGDYLTDFAVTGPPELGLPGPDTTLARIIITELPDTDDLPDQTLAVYEPGAALPTASLRFYPQARTRGAAGTRLVGHDAARTVRLVTDVADDETVSIHLQGVADPPILPGVLLPGLRLLDALHEPNLLVLTVRYHDQSSTAESPLSHVLPDLTRAEMLSFVEDLAAIQDTLRQPFPIPERVTVGDVERAHRLRGLLDGDVVPWMHATLTVTLDADKVHALKAQSPPGRTGLRVSWADYEVRIGDEVVHTGPMTMVGMVTADTDAIPDHPDPDAQIEATCTLVDDQCFHALRGLPPDEPLSAYDGLGPGVGRVAYLPAPDGTSDDASRPS